MVRNLEELMSRADEFADRFESFEPTPEDFERPVPIALAVRLDAWRRDRAEQRLAETIARARAEHMSWREVGEAIGTSGEAARKRYAPLIHG